MGWLLFVGAAGFFTLVPMALMWHIAAPQPGRAISDFTKNVSMPLSVLCFVAALNCFCIAFQMGADGACRAFSPFLALATYATLSLRISPSGDRLSRFTLSHLLGSIGWLSAYLASLRLQRNSPSNNTPHCPPLDPTSVTFARQRRGDIVAGSGSEEIAGRDGHIALVNLHLRRLKCCELALRALSPRTHRLLRAIYNRVGPRLAACCVHPLLADVAYIGLKPLEWLGVGCLRRLLPNFDALAARLYRGTN